MFIYIKHFQYREQRSDNESIQTYHSASVGKDFNTIMMF